MLTTEEKDIERLRKIEERVNNYQLVFNAIADACRIEAGHISISVRRFKESLLSDPQGAEPPRD